MASEGPELSRAAARGSDKAASDIAKHGAISSSVGLRVLS
jgi:hypothetical protein